jgi:hypothetical protein
VLADVTVAALDPELVSDFNRHISENPAERISRSAGQALHTRGLAVRGTPPDEFNPTAAAFLLFGPQPANRFPHYEILADAKGQSGINAPLPRALEQALKFVDVTDPRVLIVTDRVELDEQIEKVFLGVNEDIYRTDSGADLVAKLNSNKPWLICSLIHKFGTKKNGDDDGDADEFIAELKKALPPDFKPKGNLFVFVDECHRTQSGKLYEAMKEIPPGAVSIGFTGTPLLKADKQKSIKIFGRYIHTYKFDEAVKHGVVLDLRYEAREIDQSITSQKKIDEWFELKTLRGSSSFNHQPK